jgi:anthranilate phosphoribosyltransferase
MQPLRELLERLLLRRDLAEADAQRLLEYLTNPEVPPALAGAVLAALRSKGVVADEVRGFARAMRQLARRPQIAPDLRAIDIVGTGGDASGSLNISTGTALLTAACGVPVVKHGNRSVSSRAGSADVLEALGLVLPLDAAAAGRCLAATNFTFLFAPHYHPAMQAIAPVRAPEDYGLARCRANALAGRDAAHNARALRAVLYGEDRGAHRDCLLLGAALALEVAGEVQLPREGIARAAAAIDGGAARRVLDLVSRFEVQRA